MYDPLHMLENHAINFLSSSLPVCWEWNSSSGIRCRHVHLKMSSAVPVMRRVVVEAELLPLVVEVELLLLVEAIEQDDVYVGPF
jgi:hypothetical protein